VLSWKNFYCQGRQLCSIIMKLHLCACSRLRSRSLGKIGSKSQCFLGRISIVRRPQHFSIIRKLHICACARLSSRSLGKIGAEITVLSWNNFYCQWTRTLSNNQETAPLRMRKTKLSLSLQDRC
jgi:hypothetical protein